MPMSSTDSMAATSTITAAYDPKQGHRYYIYQITSGSINSLEIIMRVDDGPGKEMASLCGRSPNIVVQTLRLNSCHTSTILHLANQYRLVAIQMVREW